MIASYGWEIGSGTPVEMRGCGMCAIFSPVSPDRRLRQERVAVRSHGPTPITANAQLMLDEPG